MCVSQASYAMARRFNDGQERPPCPARPAAWEPPQLVFHDPAYFGGAATAGTNPHVEALHRQAALAALPKGPSGGPARSPAGERGGHRGRVKQGLRAWVGGGR